jgi:SAM-dependent methyltransferase
MDVTPIEPSASMRAQRPSHLAPAIDAVAEELPFADNTFDAALATVTIHQWRDLAKGLAEMRRVTRGAVVIMTFDPEVLQQFWLSEFSPTLISYEAGRMPALAKVTTLLEGTSKVKELAIPFDCEDGFAEAYFGRPEAFLDERVRRSQSAWGFLSRDDEIAAVRALQTDLETGSWDKTHGHLRHQHEYHGALRLITAVP